MRSIHDNPAFAPLIEARATMRRAVISTQTIGEHIHRPCVFTAENKSKFFSAVLSIRFFTISLSKYENTASTLSIFSADSSLAHLTLASSGVQLRRVVVGRHGGGVAARATGRARNQQGTMHVSGMVFLLGGYLESRVVREHHNNQGAILLSSAWLHHHQANGQIQFGAEREAEAMKATDTVFTQVWPLHVHEQKHVDYHFFRVSFRRTVSSHSAGISILFFLCACNSMPFSLCSYMSHSLQLST